MIGGGTILIPLLLMLGYDTKVAIGISVIQMVFSSTYGSYLNHKKGTLDIAMVLVIGLGGFVGVLVGITIKNRPLPISQENRQKLPQNGPLLITILFFHNTLTTRPLRYIALTYT